jgi:hypothetical protein
MEPIYSRFGLLQAFPFIFLFFLLLAMILQFIALLDIMKSKFEGTEKTNWELVVTLAPVIGSIVYFIAKPKPSRDSIY